jgi:uncharacterized protein YndB with AHSA1/START domain
MSSHRSTRVRADQPSVSVGPAPGTVSVVVTVAAPREQAWGALVDREHVGRWLGELSGDVRPGAHLRLDFLDGDFFALDVSRVDAPGALEYRWRFLGIGPACAVRWRLEDQGDTRVVVEDTVPDRSWAESRELGSGWADFLRRYAEYVRTGAATRYEWREQIDGSVELPRGVDRLFDGSTRQGWLPLHDHAGFGSVLEVPGPGTPWAIPVDRVRRPSPTELELSLRGPRDDVVSTCRLELRRAGADALLTFAHDGWRRLLVAGDDPRPARTRLTGMWVDAVRRARALVDR